MFPSGCAAPKRYFCTGFSLSFCAYCTARPCFSDSHDHSYIPTAKEGALRLVSSAGQAADSLEKIKAEVLPASASNNQTVLAKHYQTMIHTNDFYEYLKLCKELYQKQNAQRSRGRKVNAMDSHFSQMVERVLREELAVAFSEPLEAADKRLKAAMQ